MERIHKVLEHRLKSSRKETKELARYPTLFDEDRQPETDYILIPLTSSENRKYIPISFFSKDNITNNSCSVIPDSNMFHFGVLISEMHMTWMRYVAGRLKGDYRYSNTIVYNNFPWPTDPSEKDIKNVEEKAKEILKTRNEFKDSSLADLYNPLTMPPRLSRAHRELDKVVDKCYENVLIMIERG